MTGNDEKMRAVLRAEAATVLPSADAWSRITEGVERQRRRRHWMQYGGLAAAASAAAVVTVVLLSDDGRTPGPGPTVPATQPAPTSTGGPKPSPTSPASATPTPAETKSAPPAPAVPQTFVAAVQRKDGPRLAVFASATGKTVRTVDWDPGEFGINEVDVSSDRKWIYTIKSLGDACQATIVRIPLAGGPAEDVVDETGPDGAEIFSLALSGDGKRVAYLRNPRCDSDSVYSTELVVREIESGRETKRLKLTDPAPHGFPRTLAWQPGDDRLAIVFAGDGPSKAGLLDAATAKDVSDVTMLQRYREDCHLGNPAFTGEFLYATQNCEPDDEPWTSEIMRFDPASGRLRSVEGEAPGKERYIVAMDTDPTGQELVVAVAEGKDGRTEERWIYRVRPGAEPVEILHSDTPIEHLSW